MHEVVITCGSDVIARHERSYEREAVVFDPLHYGALIDKTRALDQAAAGRLERLRSASPRFGDCWKLV